jgi:hypothetical protein
MQPSPGSKTIIPAGAYLPSGSATKEGKLGGRWEERSTH